RPLLLLEIWQKIYLGYDVRAWKDPRIPTSTSPARSARPNVLVAHLIINTRNIPLSENLMDIHILKAEEYVVYVKPSIAKLQHRWGRIS
ncbi:hypothetical protein IGI04_018700, partial [Brassica rapa subsp. trilocularis]